jgi:hypothetical protein
MGAFSMLVATAGSALAQAPAAPAPSAAPDPTDKPPLKQEELDQMLAPIALYPDSLLTQVLMASTYPLEIVQADRWAKTHKGLKDAELTAALEKETWDASVKSLLNFPEVLGMMSEKLDLTIKLGDAFIAQQADVMNTVQKLRGKAKGEGNLASNEQQKVSVQPAPAQTTITVEQVTPPPTEIIVIEPTQPEVVYVPSYSPSYVYGTWPYPGYPPAPYYPPGYVASNMVSFGVGVAVGAAWGYAWGNCNWGHGDVDIDIDRNTNINNNIDRSKYKAEFQNRQTNRSGERAGAQSGRGSWQHNPQHRQGVPYRDQRSAQRVGASDYSRQAAAARDSYRGRSSAATTDASRGGGFSGVDRGGSSARADSQRGQTSRSSSASASNRSSSGSRGSASSRGGSSGGGARSSGGSRGGGGGSRGGGGRR